MDSAQPLCSPIRHRTQSWISNDCLDLVDERKCVKLVDYNRYRQLNLDVRKRLKEEREAYWNQVAANLEEAASKHEYHTLYRILRRLSGKSKSTSDNIRNNNGTFVRSSTERMKRWKEFFENSTTTTSQMDQLQIHHTLNHQKLPCLTPNQPSTR